MGIRSWSTVAGSESTYVCDYCGYDASGVVLHVGGNYNQNQNHGAFYLNGNNAASNANANIGCRHLANGLRQSAHFSVRPFPRLCIDGRDSRVPLGEERCRRDAGKTARQQGEGEHIP